MKRKIDVNNINLQIDNVDFWSPHERNRGGMRIYWSSDIGFGELTIVKTKGTEGSDYSNAPEEIELIVDSEYMDIQADKSFTNKLLSLLVERLIVVG